MCYTKGTNRELSFTVFCSNGTRLSLVYEVTCTELPFLPFWTEKLTRRFRSAGNMRQGTDCRLSFGRYSFTQTLEVCPPQRGHSVLYSCVHGLLRHLGGRGGGGGVTSKTAQLTLLSLQCCIGPGSVVRPLTCFRISVLCTRK